jgi:hypothetical protein
MNAVRSDYSQHVVQNHVGGMTQIYSWGKIRILL